jgi:hypothetical protein
LVTKVAHAIALPAIGVKGRADTINQVVFIDGYCIRRLSWLRRFVRTMIIKS